MKLLEAASGSNEFSKLRWLSSLHEYNRTAQVLKGAMWAVITVYYADSSRDGTNSHPGFARLVEITGFSRMQCIRATQALVSAGLILQTQEGGGRGRASVYRLGSPWINSHTGVTDSVGVDGSDEGHAVRHAETERVTSGDGKGHICGPKGSHGCYPTRGNHQSLKQQTTEAHEQVRRPEMASPNNTNDEKQSGWVHVQVQAPGADWPIRDYKILDEWGDLVLSADGDDMEVAVTDEVMAAAGERGIPTETGIVSGMVRAIIEKSDHDHESWNRIARIIFGKIVNDYNRCGLNLPTPPRLISDRKSA